MASSLNASTAGGGGVIVTSDASGILQLQSAGTATVTVDASGNVGIGTASPVAKLDIRDTTAIMQLKSNTGTNAVYATINNTGGDFYIGRDNSAGGTFGTTAAYASVLYSSGAYPMVFFTNATERMRIDSTGASTFTGTGKFATTIGVGNATPSASGSGITFPATQSASSDANTLDDYEEGTFTPNVVGATVAGTFTYSERGSRYTKIGNTVTFQIPIYVGATTISAVGAITITGLPFTTSSLIAFQTVSIGWVGQISFVEYLSAYLSPSTTSIILRNNQSNAFGGNVIGSDLTSSFYIFIGGTYQV